jgi:hypothetical protein
MTFYKKNMNFVRKILWSESLNEVKNLKLTDFQNAFGEEPVNCSNTRLLYNSLVALTSSMFVKNFLEIQGVSHVSKLTANDKCDLARSLNLLRHYCKYYSRTRSNLESRTVMLACNPKDLGARDKKKYRCQKNEWESPCPSYDYLVAHGKTCEDLIQSSQRANYWYNRVAKLVYWAEENPRNIMYLLGGSTLALLLILRKPVLRGSQWTWSQITKGWSRSVKKVQDWWRRAQQMMYVEQNPEIE